jgi:hypothetical protein
VRPNHSLKVSPNGVAHWACGAGASPQFCAAVPARHTAGPTLARTLDPANTLSRKRTCIEYVFDVPCTVLTIYETPIFVAEAAKIWSTEERLEFFAWIAGEPEAGAVIAGSGGCRKVRWSRPGMGKQGGARVIYFTRIEAGELCMLLVYPKAARDTIPGHILKAIRKEIEDDDS